jgi:transcriptional regulator with XRE-family HTH domain
MEKGGPRLSANRRQQKALLSLLRRLRTDAGLTQVEMAERLGKPQPFVSYYESGARRLDLLELRQICGVLGISLVDLVRQFEKALRQSLGPRT